MYLVKVSVVIGIFYVCYKGLLQRETFFEKNRLFLILGIISAFLVPFIVIPHYVEIPAATISSDVLSFSARSENTVAESYSILDLLILVYSLGVLVFGTRFLIQLWSLMRLIFSHKIKTVEAFTFVETRKDIAPFSFFKYIVYNPEQFSSEELDQIIMHEKVHATQFHSLDILLGQLSCIVLWFNPFIWLHYKALKQNLEFIADHNAIQKSSCKKNYQYTLLKTSFPKYQFALSNPFYNSLIKKRIIMLQQSKSKKIKQIKFALVIPVLTLFLMSFNTKTIYVEKDLPKKETTNTLKAPEKPEAKDLEKTESISAKKTVLKQATPIQKASVQERINYVITKNTSNSELDGFVADANSKGVTLKFKGVKRNDNNDIISIKIEAKSKDSNANYNYNSDTPIDVIKVSFDKDGKGISIGNAAMKYKVSKVKTTKGGAYVISNGDSDAYTVSSDDHGNQKIVIRNVSEAKTNTDKVKVKKIVEKHKNKNKNDNDNEAETIVLVDEDESPQSVVVRAVEENDNSGNVSVETASGEEPLYVLDGKKVNKDAIKDLSPNDIEKINVLKGDSAIKKYGKKAKDGVVEIITKK